MANSNKNNFGTLTEGKEQSCFFCNGFDDSTKCNLEMSLFDRRELLAGRKKCLRYLRFDHTADKCRNPKINCSQCRGKHFLIMCSKRYNNSEKSSNSSVEFQTRSSDAATKTNAYNTCFQAQDAEETVEVHILMTRFVWVSSNKKRTF